MRGVPELVYLSFIRSRTLYSSQRLLIGRLILRGNRRPGDFLLVRRRRGDGDLRGFSTLPTSISASTTH
jgi:hypothetical protein